jgi:hypothetical protein
LVESKVSWQACEVLTLITFLTRVKPSKKRE